MRFWLQGLRVPLARIFNFVWERAVWFAKYKSRAG